MLCVQSQLDLRRCAPLQGIDCRARCVVCVRSWQHGPPCAHPWGVASKAPGLSPPMPSREASVVLAGSGTARPSLGQCGLQSISPGQPSSGSLCRALAVLQADWAPCSHCSAPAGRPPRWAAMPGAKRWQVGRPLWAAVPGVSYAQGSQGPLPQLLNPYRQAALLCRLGSERLAPIAQPLQASRPSGPLCRALAVLQAVQAHCFDCSASASRSAFSGHQAGREPRWLLVLQPP